MRRVEELLMSPKSGCTVHWLTFIYPHPIVSCKILRLCASVFARHFAQDDRVNGVAGCPRSHVPATFRCIMFRERRVAAAISENERYYITQPYSADSDVSPLPCSAKMRYCITQPYSADSDVSPLPYSAKMRYCITQPHSADSDVSPQPYPRTNVITLHNLIPRTAACRRCRIPRKCVIALHRLIPRTAAAHLLLRNAQNYP